MRDRAWTWWLILPLVGLTLVMCFDARAAQTEPGRTAVIAVHGGGWYKGSPVAMERICDDVRSRGTECFAPSYTLSGVAPFNAAPADLKAFAEQLRAAGYTRLVGIGFSAGGNLVGWMAQKGLLDAAVLVAAPLDLTRLPDWYREACECWVIQQYAPTPWKRWAASPTLHEKIGPVLLVHARLDKTIPVSQSKQYVAVHTDAELRIVEEDGHALALWDTEGDGILDWALN